MTTTDSPTTRPRVEGDREQQILDATLDVLAEVGYDRLTMDAVAAAARASKATLYRRWDGGKAHLVIDALVSQKAPLAAPDTGTLRGDLLGAFCGVGGLTDAHQMAVLGSVITAIGRDAEFATAFRRDFIAPKAEQARVMFERGRDRGEVGPDVDLDLLVPALAGIVLHRVFMLGQAPTPDLIAAVVDQIILPAATRGLTGPTSTAPHQEP